MVNDWKARYEEILRSAVQTILNRQEYEPGALYLYVLPSSDTAYGQILLARQGEHPHPDAILATGERIPVLDHEALYQWVKDLTDWLPMIQSPLP